jgi:hypothetical protein
LQAEFKAPLLALQAVGFAGEGGEVGAHWQARGLRLWSDTRPPAGRRRSVADGLRRASGFGADTQLLQVGMCTHGADVPDPAKWHMWHVFRAALRP